MKNNKKRIISLLIVFTMLIPIVVQALGLATIQLKITDDESGISEILLPDGTITTDTDIEYAITKNGFYKFAAYDNAGNIAQEFIIEISDINENTNMDEIENIIKEAEDELKDLIDNNEKDKLEQELNSAKEDYDDEIKSRIDKIDESIDNMTTADEKEIIEYEINSLPTKYQSSKYSPTLEKEKDRLNQKLQDKIDGLSNKNELEIAIGAVEKAEKTLNQDDVDSAREKVNNLKDESRKDTLNERLDKVQALIDKIKDIEKEIGNMEDLKDKDKIQSEIDKLPDGKEKDRLQQELDNKVEELEAKNSSNKVLKEAIEAVIKAEKTLQQKDLDNAWQKVRLLPEGNDRNQLTDRLNIAQELIFTIKQIEKDINNMKSLEDEPWIQREIDRLPNGSEKDRLQRELDDKVWELEKLNDKDRDLERATEAVEKAEKTITQRDVDKAWILVNRLPRSRSKDNLVKRLEKVQGLIDRKETEGKELEEAIKVVEKAEVTLQQKDLDVARENVEKLPESIIKDSLNKRLDLVQKLIDGLNEKENAANKDKEDEKLLEEALDAVKKAEVTMKDEDIKNAKDKVDKLEDGTRKDILKERIQLIEKLKGLKDEIEKGKQEGNTQEKPQVQEPKPEVPKVEKPTVSPSNPGTSASKPFISKPSTSSPSTNSSANQSSSGNNGYNYEDGGNIFDEGSIEDNPYYKKPIRSRQTRLFKLKEPEKIADSSSIESELELETEDIEIPEKIEDIEVKKPKNNKIFIIIVLALILILVVGGGVLFIRSKKNREENVDD